MSQGLSLLVVGGYAGVGKTRIINEIYKPLARENGNFISGKFNQFSQNSPYAGFVQAFRARINQILAENEAKFEFWKSRISEALADNGSLMIDVVPDLRFIIGDQPQALKLGFNESHSRFRKVFCDFVGALATDFEPLVFFMDDLQWADSDSIDLIHTLLNEKEIKHILMICAYRDNEVSPSHPFRLMLKRLDNQSARVESLKLKELSGSNVNQLIADSLKLVGSEVTDLSDLIHKKTAGNPFFIKQFLQNLVQQGMIYFDQDERKWRWHINEILQVKITDNVVDLVLYKLQTLPERTQIVLRLAAAIGNTFHISTVSTISQIGEREVAKLIWDVVDLSLIQPTEPHSRHINDDIWDEIGIDIENAVDMSFRFQHDKIQQAAYGLIDEADRKQTHFQIGSLLLSVSDRLGEIENLYEIVNHLNIGSDLITSKEKSIQLAELNLEVGNIVKNSNSYDASVEYLRKAMDLISPDDDQGLYRKILISRSEAEYLNGDYDQSEKMYDIALDNTDSGLMKAEIFAEKMKLYENTSRHTEAIQSALAGLKILGLNIPEKPGTVSILQNLLQTKWMLRNKSIEDLKKQPVVEQPELILKMKILMNLWGPAYLYNPNLLVLAILKLVQLSIRMGNAPESALAYAFYGYVSCAQLKDFKKGHEFAKLGIWLNEKFNDKTYRSKVYVIYAGCVAHWRESFPETIEWLRKAHIVGQESNDLVYAGYAYNFLSKNLFWSGERLESLIDRYIEFVHFARGIHSQATLHHLLGQARMLYDLLGWQYSQDIFQDSIDENQHVEQITALAENDGIWLPLVSRRIYRAYSNYYFGKYEDALDNLEKAKTNLVAVLGLFEVSQHNFTTSMVLLALARKEPSKWRRKALRVSKSNQKIAKIWSLNCPANFRAAHLLVEAEINSVQGRSDKAILLYSQADEAATNESNLQFMALVKERMSIHYSGLGIGSIANLLLQQSYQHYRQWGAHAKADQIRSKLLLSNQLVSNEDGKKARSELVGTTSSSLDLESIFRASTAISGEVVFNNLLRRLLLLVMENAGAQRAILVMVKNQELFLAARAVIDNPNVEIMTDLGLEEAHDLARSIVRYCLNAESPVIVDNPDQHTQFQRDPYLKKQAPKSILCQPILQSGRCIAIIYLEHQNIAGVFTKDRLEVLNLLSGQIAVSLQNAELYKSQQELNEVYHRFVPLDFIQALGHESILKVKLGDSIDREMTVMFCDIRSYTSLSEGMNASEIFNLINQYLQAVGPVIIRHGGFINHYLGDGFVALFDGVPDQSIKAAIEIFQILKPFNEERLGKSEKPVHIGIGLHRGPVIMGIIGDEQRNDVNVLSDAVNIASRLESLTRPLNSQIIISKSTLREVSDQSFFTYRNLGRYKLKGKSEATDLFEIIDSEDIVSRNLKTKTYNNYNLAIDSFSKGEFNIAKEYFQLVIEENPGDKMCQRFIERISMLEKSPLPPDWNSTEIMEK
jgi:predicted ATPase/class 3 adenylate cyclase